MIRLQPSTVRPSLARLAPAALLLALAPRAALAQHAGAGHHESHGAVAARAADSARAAAAPAGDSAAPAGVRRVVRNGVAIDFSVTPVRRAQDADSARVTPAGIREREDAVLRLRLTDAATGRVLSGLAPAAWIDRREAGLLTGADACKAKVDRFVQASTSMEQALKVRALVDLNSYYVLSLNRSPDISVLDPHLGFGRTKLYTTVRLRSPGEDWVLSGDQDRLYVAMPRAGRVAVVNTDNWKVLADVDAGRAPLRVALQPDERYLWVVNGADSAGRSGVTVVDRSTLEIAARIPAGAGARDVVFSDDGRLAFVLNREGGTLTVVDVPRLTAVKEIPVGTSPVDVAWAPAGGAAYVIDEATGVVSVVDATSLEVVRRIRLEPGVRTIRFAPRTGSGHAHHGGHAVGTSAADAAGRLGFVLNPRANTVTLLDATNGEVLRTTAVGVQPDQVSFTSSFAYIRSAGSAEVAMIPLVDPSAGGVGNLDKFPAGHAAPSAAGALSEADAIVRAPDMPDAVYVLNPKERMIYYFHYMEGMPIPSGGLTTYGFDPKAVLVAGKDLREEEPGVYSATVRLADRGDYDVVFLLDEPRVTECFDLSVHANPAIRDAKLAVDIVPLERTRRLVVGGNVLRFRVTDLFTGEPRDSVADLGVILAATSGWRQRASARAVGDGVYEVSLDVPSGGAYYLSFAAPSLRLEFNDRPPIIYRAARVGRE